jgi:hypothetical protein
VQVSIVVLLLMLEMVLHVLSLDALLLIAPIDILPHTSQVGAGDALLSAAFHQL